MSSILKALQKLETDSTQQAKGRLLTGKATIRLGRRRHTLSICLILILFLTASGIFLINRPTDNLNSIADINADKQGIGAAGSAARLDSVEKKIAKTAKRKEIHQVQADPTPENPVQMYPLNQTVKTTGIQATLPSPSAKSDSGVRQVVLKPADTGKPVKQDKEKSQSAPLETQKPTVEQINAISTTPDLQVIDPLTLKLQAISWSPYAKDRMAVINESIVREKGSIKGYVIILINQDSVIVKKGAEKGRLVF